VWEAVAMMILIGPAACNELIERSLDEVATEQVRRTRARPEGGTSSPSTIESYAEPLNWVTRTLRELRARGFPCAELSGWDLVPKVRKPVVAQVASDRSAPPLRAVRLARKRLRDEVRARLGACEGEDELMVLERLAPGRLRNVGVWRPARNRAIFEVLCMTACREDAVCGITHEHIDRARPRQSGGVGAAIAILPAKNRPADELSWKPIEQETLHHIDVYIAITVKILEVTCEVGGHEPPHLTWLKEGPLFLAELSDPPRPIQACAIYAFVTGQSFRNGRGGSPPLMPRSDGGWHSPHSLRRRGRQNVRNAATWLTEEERGGVDGDTLAEALLDHEIPRDRLKYQDVNTPQGRERCAEIGIRLNHRLLATELGADTRRDGPAFRVALQQEVALEAEIARAQGDLNDAEEALAQGGRLSPKLVPQILFAGRRIDTLREKLGQVRARTERLRHDSATRVSVPDDFDEELEDEFDAIEAEVRGVRAALDSPVQELVLVRDFITVPEYAELGGFSPATARRHVRGENLPYRPGDPRRPWEPDNVPVDGSLGPRRRRIQVAGINPGFFRTEAARRRLAEILSEMPRGWADARSQ
jgi:hypothetical protein